MYLLLQEAKVSERVGLGGGDTEEEEEDDDPADPDYGATSTVAAKRKAEPLSGGKLGVTIHKQVRLPTNTSLTFSENSDIFLQNFPYIIAYSSLAKFSNIIAIFIGNSNYS